MFNPIGKILRFVVVVGCIVGAVAYYSNKTNKRNLVRQIENTERLKQVEKAKKEEQLRKEEEMNANNAKYQVRKWREQYQECWREFYDAQLFGDDMPRSKMNQIKRDLKSAYSQLRYWAEKRMAEIIKEEESKGSYNTTKEYDELMSMLESIDNDISNAEL